MESFPLSVDKLKSFDDDRSDPRRDFDDDTDVDTNGRERAWNTDRSVELPLRDDNTDLWRDGPSFPAVAEDHHNHSVDSRMGASVASREEAQLQHCHPVSCPHRGRAVDDCRWHYPLLEYCSRLMY